MTESGHYSRNGFLTSRGYREVALRSCEALGLDAAAAKRYLDRVSSVSASPEAEDDFDYDSRHVELNRRLIHNGS